LLIAASLPAFAQQKKEILYIGTFSVRGSEGIYVLEFDPDVPALKVLQAIPTKESPSYVEIHPSGKFLYSANRGSVDGIVKTNGSVSSFSIDPLTGRLHAINGQQAFGLGPCHIGINPAGTFAVVSHFHAGTLAVYPLLDDGSMGTMTDSIRYSGKGLDPQRQNQPHIHSATFAPGNQAIIVADLGTDKIYSYRTDLINGKLVPSSQSSISTKPGTGPRHLAFHPNGKNFYLAEEISSTVAVFGYDKKTGTVEIVEDEIRSLPQNFNGKNSAADIQISPDGKFVYVSNRGHNALAIFSVLKNGKLKLIGHQDVMGKTPRFHFFDKTGEFLLVANQDSDNITVFKKDSRTGMLTFTGVDFKLPSPVCIKSYRAN
jgi:6-phosphogluconolactonase